MDSRSTGWTEVGDRCFARRYEPYDVTVGAVLGEHGVLLLDTRTSPAQAREVVADLRALTNLPVRFVVNSHWHFDHTFGNGAFAPRPTSDPPDASAPDASSSGNASSDGPPSESDTPAAVVAHRTVPGALAERGDAYLERLDPATREEVGSAYALAGTITDTFASVRVLDLGGRVVELVHPGRGHTDGDLVARVDDADVVYMGDLVEQSGPPVLGEDSYPLEWPNSLELVEGLLTPRTAVVPGHGDPIDRDFVRQQRRELVDVAETIHRLWSSGVPEAEAADSPDAADSWPYPVDHLRTAIARGYAALRDTEGGSGRTLPVVS